MTGADAPGTFFDAHLQAEALRARDLTDLRFFGVAGALVPLPAGRPSSTAADLRRAWEDLAVGALGRMRQRGFAAFGALSVPPDRIPARGLEALLAELPDWLSRPRISAIGPVGAGSGSPREEEVLSRQLEMARELRVPVLLEVPPPRGPRQVRRAIALLQESALPPERVLVDGTDARTVRLLRAVGYVAVLSLSAGGGEIDAPLRIVRSLGPEGIAFASHAGDGTGDLLALPRAADRMARAGLSAAVIRRVCGRNALEVLGIAPADVRDAGAPSARSDRRTSR